MYDPFDPFGAPDPLRDPFAPRRGPGLPPMPPAEAESKLSALTGAAAGGLHFLGGTLDKLFGGRAVRAGLGMLSGKDVAPSELLSVIPGSDLANITDEKNRVSGEGLLKHWGALEGEGEKGTFELRDLAGPALELALDPATLVSGLGTTHALTAAGEAAAKAGTLASTMAGRIAAKQAGLLSVGLPFAEKTPLLTGKTGEYLAGKLGSVGDSLLYGTIPHTSISPGRALSSLFSEPVGGTRTETFQRAAREMQPGRAAADAAARAAYVDVGKRLDAGGALRGLPGDPLRQELRQALEGTASPLPGGAVADAAAAARGYLDAAGDAARTRGRPLGELADPAINYAPRQVTDVDEGGRLLSGSRRGAATGTASQAGREDFLTGFPEGSGGVDRLVNDQGLAARLRANPAELQARADIRGGYLGFTPQEEAAARGLRASVPNLPPGTTLSPAEQAAVARLNALEGQSEKLASWLPTLDPERPARQLGLFGNHPLADLGRYLAQEARANSTTDVIHEAFARGATTTPGKGMLPYEEALRRAGLTYNEAAQQVAAPGVPRPWPSGQGSGAQASALERLAAQGKPGRLNQYFVPEELIGDAGRLRKAFDTPEALEPVLKAWDSLTNLTKMGQTSLWPAFHTRNALTGLWQAFVGGATDPRHAGPAAYARPFLDAGQARRGEAFAGANLIKTPAADLTGLSDADATRRVLELFFEHGGQVGGNQFNDVIGLGSHANPGKVTLPGSPDAAEQGLGELLGGLFTGQWAPRVRPGATRGERLAEFNPLAVRGVGANTETAFAPAKYGAELGTAVDDVNKLSSFIAFLRQGHDPAQAMAKSLALHYTGVPLTGFENQVMKRLAPFYSWSRQNIPRQLEQLLARPGGPTAAAVKAGDDLAAQQTFTPEYLAGGLNIPVGREDGGAQRFLGSAGLPFEDVGQLLGGGAHPVLRTGEHLLAMANPLVKGPVELLSGHSFHAGKDLEDLRGPTRDPVLNQVVANSPLGRAGRTAREALDPEKGWGDFLLGLTGPGRITSADLDRQKLAAARGLVEESLRGEPGVRRFEGVSASPEAQALLDPEALDRLRLLRAIEARQKDAAGKKPRNVGVRSR